MSNYLGRKSEFTPSVYTRYFEQTDTPKTPQGHIYFDEDQQDSSPAYQTKRDLIFKRLFPAKYADANNNNPNGTELTPVTSNGAGTASNYVAQPLGDFIPLFEVNTPVSKRESALSPRTDITLSSSDEDDDDPNVEYELPTVKHVSIVGNVHSRLAIENVRAVMIRELYQRTSDSHTEWLKCKMEIPKEFINPKYYADFQRRYKYEIRKHNNTLNRKSTSRKTRTEQGYHVIETKRVYQETVENDDIIEIKSTKSVTTASSVNVRAQSQAIPEFIVLDSADDDGDDNNLDYTRSSDQSSTTFFVDRSSSISRASLQSTSAPQEDYLEEDSKYAQLPSRTASSSTLIRPILSKNQRRKKKTPNVTATTEPATPLVSAIGRIIDQMDQSNPKDPAAIAEEKNLLLKTMKKRKKKKKKTKSPISTID